MALLLSIGLTNCSGPPPAGEPAAKAPTPSTREADPAKTEKPPVSPAPFDAVVEEVAATLADAASAYDKGDIRAAKKLQQDAYYASFEAKGMEVAIREHVSAARAFELEELFARVRDALGFPGSRANVDDAVAELVEQLRRESRHLANVMSQNGS